jgi:putative ABC transport system permease protein
MANRTRAALTMLGIIIGVASVISLISLGRGVEKFVKEQFNSLGANMLVVTTSQPKSPDRTRVEPLTTEDIATLQDGFTAPSITQIAPQYNLLGFINGPGESMRTAIRGVEANYAEIRNWQPELGRFITDEQVQRRARVALIGPEVVTELYGDGYDPVGEVIRVNGQAFTVIGVMEGRSDPFNNDNAAVLVPISTAQTKLSTALSGHGYEVHILYVQADNEAATALAEVEIENYLNELHDIQTEDEKDYTVLNMGEQLKIAGAITSVLTVFLGLIAGVSLLVGGIGITNIMLVTVTERTHEIGLRKALGARPRDILLQFLLESIILCLFGGAIGLLIGYGVAAAGTALVKQLTLSVDTDAVIVAIGVSSGVGLFFGIFPANRAARMNPIDALRFE